MARLASMARLARILALVPWVIQHPADATVAAVCARFAITEAELLDDLNLLFMCGIPPFEPGDLIEAGIEGDHVVIRMADYLARPLRLTRWEALSLLAAGKAIASLGVADPEALKAALSKIEAAVDPDEAEAAALLAERIGIELDPAPPETLAAVRDAIEHRRTLTIEYYSLSRDEVTVRDVDPLLVAGARPWYLIAHDHRSNERRTFRVDRIHTLVPSGGTFERPAGFDPSAEAAAPLYHPSADDRRVVLELTPAARWVAEVTPHDAKTVLQDGGVRLRLRTGRTAWLEHLLLMLGPDAVVIEPVSLRAGVAAAARRALARYH